MEQAGKVKTYHQWTGESTGWWQAVGETTPALKPGIYNLLADSNGPVLNAVNPQHDKMIVVEDGVTEHLLNGIVKFWDKKALYKTFGMLHKRGVLLEGPPGTGKTIATMLLCRKVVERGAASILFTRPSLSLSYLTRMLAQVREIHPDIPLVVVLEDINAIIDPEYSGNRVESLLSILDGQNQIDNVVYLATTNFIEKLDARITNRPSRFDEVIHVGPPSAKSRRSYLQQMIPAGTCTDGELDRMVKDSDGLMMAHMREMVVSHLALDKPLNEVTKRLKDMQAEALRRAELGEEEDDE